MKRFLYLTFLLVAACGPRETILIKTKEFDQKIIYIRGPMAHQVWFVYGSQRNLISSSFPGVQEDGFSRILIKPKDGIWLDHVYVRGPLGLDFDSKVDWTKGRLLKIIIENDSSASFQVVPLGENERISE